MSKEILGEITKPKKKHRLRNTIGAVALVTSPLLIYNGVAVGMRISNAVPMPAAFIPNQLPPENKVDAPLLICAADDEECTPKTALAVETTGAHDQLNEDDLEDFDYQTFIETENDTFLIDNGASGSGLGRAMIKNEISGTVKNIRLIMDKERPVFGVYLDQGGSNINRQVISHMYMQQKPNASKVEKIQDQAKEIQYAFTLDNVMKEKYGDQYKQKILLGYMNHNYYGRGANSLESAAQAYFGKSYKKLNKGQKGILPGRLQAPSNYTGNSEADTRQIAIRLDHTIDSGIKNQTFTDDEVEEMQNYRNSFYTETDGKVIWHSPFTPNHVVGKDINTDVADSMCAYKAVMAIESAAAYQLGEKPGQLAETHPGMEIHSTLRKKDQKALCKAVKNNRAIQNDDKLQTAAVARNKAGEIVALVGDKDNGHEGINLATGKDGGGAGRKAGSAFKGLIAAYMYENGVSPDKKFVSKNDMTFDGWHLTEGSGCNHANLPDGCKFTIKEMVKNSANPIAGYAIKIHGFDAIKKDFRANGLTIQDSNPSGLIGYDQYSPASMSRAYATLGNGGETVESSLIARLVDHTGKPIEVTDEHPFKSKKLYKQANAQRALSDMSTVADGGTATGKIRPHNGMRSIAVKTGTAATGNKSKGVSDVTFNVITCLGKTASDGQEDLRSVAFWAGNPKGNITITNSNIQSGSSLGPMADDYVDAVQSGRSCDVAASATRS